MVRNMRNSSAPEPSNWQPSWKRLADAFDERPGLSWLLGTLALVSLGASSGLGKRLPMAVQNLAFTFLVANAGFLALMAWVRLTQLWKAGDAPAWRSWISALGCVALSFAIALPFVVMFSMLSWTRWGIACLGASVTALVCGVFAQKTMRFPLLLGGISVASLVFLIPVSVL